MTKDLKNWVGKEVGSHPLVQRQSRACFFWLQMEEPLGAMINHGNLLVCMQA